MKGLEDARSEAIKVILAGGMITLGNKRKQWGRTDPEEATSPPAGTCHHALIP